MSIDNFKADFKKVADVFKTMYLVFNPETDKSLSNINSGDCGVFALATGSVLSHLGYDFTYVDNLNHGYIHTFDEEGNEVCFDSNNYDGCSTADMNERWQATDGKVLDFAGMCAAFVPCDVKGAYMIKTVLKAFDVPVPAEIQTIFDNELDYEIDLYIGKYRAMLAKALIEIKGQ